MLGNVYMATGKFAEAEKQYDRSLKILESRRSDSAPAIARVLHSLSKAYSKLNRQSESEATLREAAKIAHDNLSKDFDMAQILEDYSRLLERHGQNRRRQTFWRRSNSRGQPQISWFVRILNSRNLSM